MKLAISNIAWSASEEPAVANLLMSRGITGVEIAPPRVWPRPEEVASKQLRQYRSFWQDRGIEIVALQSLLFGRTDLIVFGSDRQRLATLDYLKRMVDLAADLGARVLIFGSPKNRALDLDHLYRTQFIAKEFFGALGEYAGALGIAFCIEPNSKHYDCDFINTTTEAVALIRDIGVSGFGLHLDAGVLTLNNEDPDESIASCMEYLRHFHISEPFLKPLGSTSVPHDEFSQALRTNAFPHWLSIEMRRDDQSATLQSVDAALTFARQHYGV